MKKVFSSEADDIKAGQASGFRQNNLLCGAFRADYDAWRDDIVYAYEVANARTSGGCVLMSGGPLMRVYRTIENILLMLILVVSMLAAPACSTNPATGERQFNILTTSDEIRLGSEASPEFLKEYGGEIPSTQILNYTRDLGQRLANISERKDLPWEFHVVNSPVINAFALPGGKVFISRGLLAKMENEAQLVGVLGHEIGHVTAQHIGQQMSRQIGLQVGLIAIGAAASQSDEDWLRVLGVGGSAAGSLYLLKFGRDQESQADELGIRYMTKLGYNPVGQLQVLKLLKREAQGSSPPEFLSTHPAPQTRIDRVERLIKKKYPGYNDPSQYRFYEDRFKQTVLDELERLPAPPTKQKQGA